MRGLWRIPTVLGVAAYAVTGLAAAPLQSTDVDFAKIKSIFEQNCLACHGPDKQRKRLRLDVKVNVFSPDRDEPLIVPGDPGASRLYQLISLPADNKKRMPKKADPLSTEQIELIGDWINAGAPWPESDAGSHAVAPKRMKIELAALTDDQKNSEAAAIRAVRERGGLAVRVAADTIALNVSLALTSDVTDDDLALLAGSEPTLVWLNLAGASISDAGLTKLRNFAELRRLHLERTAITGAGMKHLSKLESLEYLNLYGTAVTDGGLRQLAALPALRRLYVWDTKVTEDGVARLQAALPDLVIDIGKHRLAEIPEPDQETKLAALPDCCQKAVDAGGTCDHPCCVAAAKEKKICPKCSAK